MNMNSESAGPIAVPQQLCLVLRDARPLSRLLLDLHPALLLLLLLDFQLLIPLLTLFGRRRSRRLATAAETIDGDGEPQPTGATGAAAGSGRCSAAVAGRTPRLRWRGQLCGSPHPAGPS